MKRNGNAIFYVLSVLLVTTLSIGASGGFKEFSQNIIRFGSGAGARSIEFDSSSNASRAIISADPANNELNINNKTIVNNRLEAVSTTQASKPYPTMTEAQRDLLSAVSGDTIFNSTSNQLNIFDGTAWNLVGGGGIAKWEASKDYKTDDVVWYIGDGKIYRALSDFTSGGSFNPANWSELSDKYYTDNDGTLKESGNKFVEKSFTYDGYPEYSDTSVWTTGNGAFNVGTGGTAVVKSTTPAELIDGTSVWKITGANQNDWARISYTLPQVSSTDTLQHGVLFKYKVSSDDDWEVRVNCDTEEKIGLAEAKLKSNSTRFASDYNTQIGCSTGYIGLQCVNAAGCSDILFTKMRVDDDAKVVKGFYQNNGILLQDNGGETITVSDNIPFNGTSTGWNSSDDDYTVQFANSIVTVKGNIAYNSASADLYADLYVNGSLHRAITSIQGTNGAYVQFTYLSRKGEFNRGDKLSIRGKAGTLAAGLPFSHYLTINESSETDGTVYASAENRSDILAEYSNNGGEVLGTGDNIPWATQVVDTASAWTGSSYNIKETGIWSFFGQVALNTTNNYEIYLYVDNVFKATISKVNSASSVPFGFTGHFNEGQSVSFRLSTGATLNNASSHRIYISKQAVNIDNYIIENPQGEFFTQEKVLASNHTSVGDVSGLTITGLEVGSQYILTGSTRLYGTTSGDNVLRFMSGANNTGTLYGASSNSDSATGDDIPTMSVAIIFTAQSSELYAYHTSTSSLYGNGGKDYTFLQVTKLPKSLGVDLAKQVVTNHVLGGVEYEVKGKLWDGKQVYARSWETSINMTPDTIYDIATTDTNLEIIRIECYGKAGTDWYHMESSIATNTRGFVRYASDTGNIRVVNGGANFTQQKTTIEYVK